MKKRPKKIAQWWQKAVTRWQETRHRAQEDYQALRRKQQHYEDDAPQPEEPQDNRQRITMGTAIRILLAELGEPEYWRTLWHLFWRPGYIIADYLNGKRRRFLKPFQLLIGTTIMLGIVLAIVPAEVQKEESLEVQLERYLVKHDNTIEGQVVPIENVQKIVHYAEVYRHWKEEHMAFGLVANSIAFIILSWLLFRKSPRQENPYLQSENRKANYNFAEIVTTEIFIISQLQMVNTLWVLVTGWYRPYIALDPFAFPGIVGMAIIFVDYQQLFGRKWSSTLWRTFLCTIFL